MSGSILRSEGMWGLLDRLTPARLGEALNPYVKMLVLLLGQRLLSQDNCNSFCTPMFSFISWSPLQSVEAL